MDFQVAPSLHKQLKKIKFQNQELSNKIEKQLHIFHQNHLHPSLRLHKLTGNLSNIWSISIDRSIRMLFILDEEGACFFDLGTYDQVYKK
jgi:mRNA-degrading endonuclease YafQ of YafQ-DinJ toxin-antitoxin module